MDQRFVSINNQTSSEEAVITVGSGTFKVSDLIENLTLVVKEIGLIETNKKLSSQHKGQLPLRGGVQLRQGDSVVQEYSEAWCNDGVNCEVLVPGSRGWVKGKARFKVCLEFCQNESYEMFDDVNLKSVSYPLDDFRQLINE